MVAFLFSPAAFTSLGGGAERLELDLSTAGWGGWEVEGCLPSEDYGGAEDVGRRMTIMVDHGIQVGL